MEQADAPRKPAEGAEDLDRQGLDKMIHALQNSTDTKIREYAAYLLGQAKSPRAIPSLIKALADFDKSVREQATLALSSIGKAAVEPLSKAMKEEKWQTRYRAAEALGRIADERAIKPLIQGLKDNRDHVRYMSAKALLELGDSGAIEPMIILLKDENVYVRMMAARALGAIGGKRAGVALEAPLITEKDEKVKEALKEALE